MATLGNVILSSNLFCLCATARFRVHTAKVSSRYPTLHAECTHRVVIPPFEHQRVPIHLAADTHGFGLKTLSSKCQCLVISASQRKDQTQLHTPVDRQRIQLQCLPLLLHGF